MTGVCIPRGETLRYLGCAHADENVMALVERVCGELEKTLSPVHRILPMRCSVLDDHVRFPGGEFQSRDLCRHLSGCEEIIFLAATLGSRSEMELARQKIIGVDRFAIAQAAMSAMLEKYLDVLCEKTAADYAARELFITPRFSPGYGDFSLEYQRDIFSIMDLPMRLGVRLTQGCMMLPEKSVTAIIGAGKTPCTATGHKCQNCANTNCAFRRIGI